MLISRKWLGIASMAAVLQFFCGTSLYSATFATNSFADGFVATGASGSLVNNNYGGSGSLSVAAPALSNGQFQTVLRFDLAGPRNAFDNLYGSGQWIIQSVTLQLTASTPNNAIFNASGPGQFSVSWMQNASWTEGAGTPNAPGVTGLTFSSLTNSFVSGLDESLGTFSFGGGTSGASTYTLTLSPNLSADVAAGDVLSLRLFAADDAVSYLFNAREFGTVANRPLLTITAVPEPTMLSLGAVAVFLSFCRCFVRTRKAWPQCAPPNASPVISRVLPSATR